MRTSFLVVLLIVVALLGGFSGYYLGYQHLLPSLSFVRVTTPTSVPERVAGAASTPEPTATASASPTHTPAPTIAPQTVVDSFMKNFTQIKTSNTNDPNAKNAMQYITKDAQQAVNQNANGNTAAGIAKFAGVQSVPDGGYTIGKPTATADTVIIATTWNYLSGPVTKVFYLIQEDGQWKIDTIRDK